MTHEQYRITLLEDEGYFTAYEINPVASEAYLKGGAFVAIPVSENSRVYGERVSLYRKVHADYYKAGDAPINLIESADETFYMISKEDFGAGFNIRPLEGIHG